MITWSHHLRLRSVGMLAAAAAAAAAAPLIGLAPAVAATPTTPLAERAVVTAQPSSLVQCPLLLEGDSSDCVRLLQESLNQLGVGYDLITDGAFGPSTRAAVLDFQARSGLPADGNAGDATLSELSWQTESVSSPSPGDAIAPPAETPTISAGSSGIPPASREDRPGATDCGLIASQQVFPAFFGPERQTVETDTLNGDGTVTVRGEKVVGTVALDVYRGGCGLSATVTMERSTCDEPQSIWDRVAGCGWTDWGEKRFIYDAIPTNGTVVFPPITSVAVEGSHEYRMSVTVNGTRLETVDPQGRFRGALLPTGSSFTHNGPVVRLDN